MLQGFGFATLAFAWLLPNHAPPWFSVYRELLSFLALALLATSVVRQSWQMPASVPALTLAGVAILPWIQLGLGQLHFAGDAFVSSLYLLSWSASISVGFALATRHKGELPSELAIAVVAGSAVSALLALAQSLQVAEYGIWALEIGAGDRAGANLGQPNNLATLVAWGMIATWLLYERQGVSPALACVLLFVLILGLATTQSRTALLFGPAVLLADAIVRQRGLLLRASRPAVWLVVMAAVISVALWPKFLGLVLADPDVQTLADRGIAGQRLPMWTLLLGALADKPWIGYGWLQVGAAQFHVADAFPSAGETWFQAHNLWLDLLIWNGLPLGLLLSAATLYWWISRLKRISSVASALCFLSVTVFGIHAFLELPHHYLYFLMPVGLWIGAIEVNHSMSIRAKPRPVAAAAVGLGALLVACLVFSPYLAVEDDFRRMRFQAMGVAAEPRSDASGHAALSSLEAYLRMARSEPHAGMSTSEVEALEAVVERYPYAPMMSKLSRAYAVKGQMELAQRMFRRIERMHGLPAYQGQLRNLRYRIAKLGQAELQPLLNVLEHAGDEAVTGKAAGIDEPH